MCECMCVYVLKYFHNVAACFFFCFRFSFLCIFPYNSLAQFSCFSFFFFSSLSLSLRPPVSLTAVFRLFGLRCRQKRKKKPKNMLLYSHSCYTKRVKHTPLQSQEVREGRGSLVIGRKARKEIKKMKTNKKKLKFYLYWYWHWYCYWLCWTTSSLSEAHIHTYTRTLTYSLSLYILMIATEPWKCCRRTSTTKSIGKTQKHKKKYYSTCLHKKRTCSDIQHTIRA